MKMNRTTVDELVSIRDLVLLTMCLEVIEYRRDRSFTQTEKEHVGRILDAILKDISKIKRQLKEVDIKVLFELQEDRGAFIDYPFICRGYQDRFQALKDHFRAEIKEKIKEYKG